MLQAGFFFINNKIVSSPYETFLFDMTTVQLKFSQPNSIHKSGLKFNCAKVTPAQPRQLDRFKGYKIKEIKSKTF